MKIEIENRKLRGPGVKIFTFLFSLSLLTACKKDNNEIDPGTANLGNIVFNIGIEQPEAQTKTATSADFRTTFTDGDEIGLFAVRHAAGTSASLAPAGNPIHNVKLTYSSAEGGKWTPAAPLYYSGAEMDFYAYYPYDAAATDPTNITFNVLTDQHTVAAYNKSDLLRASAMNVVPSERPVSLTFVHSLAMVQVEVAQSTMKGSGPTENLVLALQGCQTGGAFNLSGGDFTLAENIELVNMLRVEQPADANYTTQYTYRALVPAQTVPQGTKLCLMGQNEQFYHTPNLATDLPLGASNAKLYIATLPTKVTDMVKVLNGSFLMGTSNGTNIGDGAGTGLNTTPAEPGRFGDEIQHQVTLTRDFYMSKYQITNAQYAAFLNANGIGSDGKWASGTYPTQRLVVTGSSGLNYNVDKWEPSASYEDCPAVYVSWYGADEYARWMGGSLPTEAQWEYACRAGTTTPFSVGAAGTGKVMNGSIANISGRFTYDLDAGGEVDLGVGNGIYVGRTTVVGSYLPNDWGLYDMNGNIREWCHDIYASYPPGAATDPSGPATGVSHVTRGGAFDNRARSSRSGARYSQTSTNTVYYVGFRVVIVL